VQALHLLLVQSGRGEAKTDSEEESTRVRMPNSNLAIIYTSRLIRSTLQWREICKTQAVASNASNNFKRVMDGVTRKQIL